MKHINAAEIFTGSYCLHHLYRLTHFDNLWSLLRILDFRRSYFTNTFIVRAIDSFTTMKLILVCFAVISVAILHTARGQTTTNVTTSGPETSTTDFAQNPEFQKLSQLYTDENFKDCVDKVKDVCTKEPANMTQLNQETFCRMLKIYSQCIDNCSQRLKDGTSKALKQLSCDGCGFLQASLLVVLLASLLHYFV